MCTRAHAGHRYVVCTVATYVCRSVRMYVGQCHTPILRLINHMSLARIPHCRYTCIDMYMCVCIHVHNKISMYR